MNKMTSSSEYQRLIKTLRYCLRVLKFCMVNPFLDFSNGGKERKKKKERRLITKNSGLPKLLRWSHALRSDKLFYKNS